MTNQIVFDVKGVGTYDTEVQDHQTSLGFWIRGEYLVFVKTYCFFSGGSDAGS